MGVVIIPLALLAGALLGYPDEIVVVGTIWAGVLRFLIDLARDWWEARA
jgi:hypothetical protein